MPTCDCLTQYAGHLAHYVHCAVAEATGAAVHQHLDGSAARTLAELASYRDLDCALMCLRELTA